LIRDLSVTVERSVAGVARFRIQGRDRKRSGEESVFLVDARVGLDLPVGEVFVGTTNLTDATYADLSGDDAEGRALTIGIRTHFGG
jgi:hypothetical protein